MKIDYVICLGGCGCVVNIGMAYCDKCVHEVFREAQGKGFISGVWQENKCLKPNKGHIKPI